MKRLKHHLVNCDKLWPPVCADVRKPGTLGSILERTLWRFGPGREIDSVECGE